MTNTETRHNTFAKRFPGRVRRNDRRAVIAQKSSFLVDGLTTRIH